MEALLTADGLISLLSLTLMEVVLGIDNIIFISILCNRLPEDQQKNARNLGLVLALLMRIALLFGITWLVGLTKPLLTLFEFDFTYRDIILMAGGLFLIYKSTTEIHHKLEGEETDVSESPKISGFTSVIFQIILLDIVFSFDSILTAVGLVDSVMIMIVAVIISIGIMILAAGKISSFVNAHPTVKMLALSFLLLIGVLLLVEGFHVHVPKGYIYFAIFFSLLVELLNMRMRKKSKKESQAVQLKERFKE
ncbi:membrane protein [Marivirga tractuosa]|uniref:Integral membrane protein TerC n=1 Tax=Marivirga tractuosa (strain ATCC 23168 / DSM 4126 / NBRC 15989 / NCIMB 1408 / VKM B-1430 / H-43) TaxID=643867 RepID=E4TL01_MARTH|nr:TerC family protein [Marivirga tractuosa]ADR23278.1 Integral membrane protein TerC [Marivirga tractuosa DSM 4126]BDD16048.1 membrane protein [Marivirga tractuosa]